jgi:hypothetical protein
MYSINNNEENHILILLENSLTDPYYLFVCRNPFCSDESFILQPESDCSNVKEFIINQEFENVGIYDVDIYEQASYSNEDPDAAIFLKTVQFLIKVVTCDL